MVTRLPLVKKLILKSTRLNLKDDKGRNTVLKYVSTGAIILTNDGDINLGNLKPGQTRNLTLAEITKLKTPTNVGVQENTVL